MHLYEFKTLLRTQPLYIYYGIAGLAEGDRPEVLDITLQKIEPTPNYF
jgi:hypothetical protein